MPAAPRKPKAYGGTAGCWVSIFPPQAWATPAYDSCRFRLLAENALFLCFQPSPKLPQNLDAKRGKSFMGETAESGRSPILMEGGSVRWPGLLTPEQLDDLEHHC